MRPTTRQVYDRFASRYHDKFSNYHPYREKILDFLKGVQAGGAVLDLGCGSGANARLAADAGFKVTGYDYSPKMLDIARRQCPKGDFKRADLRQMSEKRTFDAVVAAFCIVHFDDDEAQAFLTGLSKLMKPEALLYVSFMEGREPAWETPGFAEEPLFYNYFDRNWVSAVLSATGLQPTSTSTHDYPERDGSTTTDVFLHFRKSRPARLVRTALPAPRCDTP